jgi:hypothetical protein
MKKLLAVILAAGFGAAVASLWVARSLATRHAAQLAEQQAAWQTEKAALEAALDQASSRAPAVKMPVAAPNAVATAAPAAPAKASPAEIVAKLRALRFARPGTRTARQAIAWLEDLIAAGPAALPAIREFLVRNEDMDFTPSGQGRGGRSANVPNEFIVPPSLRFGLFDVVKQIGGAESETLLAEVLGATGRGAEVGWLARALQEISPNKYRDVALTAARNLLARPPAAAGPNPVDRSERDQLFGVLTMFGDTSYVAAAQAQLLRPDGDVDRSALKYLQQSLGQQAVAIAAQWYDDPRLTDPAKKEPFARLALNYVGADAQADGFYQKAINDMALSENHRKNLIEDLNQDGFPDTRNLSARDLPLIQSRISFIEQQAPLATDPVNAAAFKEAYKDLLKMRERASRAPQGAQ